MEPEACENHFTHTLLRADWVRAELGAESKFGLSVDFVLEVAGFRHFFFC